MRLELQATIDILQEYQYQRISFNKSCLKDAQVNINKVKSIVMVPYYNKCFHLYNNDISKRWL